MKYVSINGNTIRQRGDGPIRIARTPSDQKPRYANEIEIVGPARLVYDPDKAIMRCGARLVIECEDVKITRPRGLDRKLARYKKRSTRRSRRYFRRHPEHA